MRTTGLGSSVRALGFTGAVVTVAMFATGCGAEASNDADAPRAVMVEEAAGHAGQRTEPGADAVAGFVSVVPIAPRVEACVRKDTTDSSLVGIVARAVDCDAAELRRAANQAVGERVGRLPRMTDDMARDLDACMREHADGVADGELVAFASSASNPEAFVIAYEKGVRETCSPVVASAVAMTEGPTATQLITQVLGRVGGRASWSEPAELPQEPGSTHFVRAKVVFGVYSDPATDQILSIVFTFNPGLADPELVQEVYQALLDALHIEDRSELTPLLAGVGRFVRGSAALCGSQHEGGTRMKVVVLALDLGCST